MLYCRSGFEKECAGEIQDKANNLEVYGFPRAKNNTGYVLFECYQDGDADKLISKLDFNSLIFARQMFAVAQEFSELPTEDRISPILLELDNLEDFPRCGDLRIETPDTNEAKELLKFCRKLLCRCVKHFEAKGYCIRTIALKSQCCTFVLLLRGIVMSGILTARITLRSSWVSQG